jgi:hypothetical protein
MSLVNLRSTLARRQVREEETEPSRLEGPRLDAGQASGISGKE